MTHEVVLYTLGGTIAMAGHHEAPGGPGSVVARLGGEQLAASVPGLAETGVRLRVADLDRIPSADLTFRQILDVLELAGAAVREGAAGAVVTQGTDTLEETAFLADLLWPHPEPLVFTGAMRNPTLAGADGPANLLAAVRAAAAPDARGLGVLVAFNDELHAARWVRKAHAASTATFVSPDAGPVGRFEEERLRLLAVPPRRKPLPAPSGDEPAAVRVALHTAVLDETGDELDGITGRYQGLIRRRARHLAAGARAERTGRAHARGAVLARGRGARAAAHLRRGRLGDRPATQGADQRRAAAPVQGAGAAAAAAGLRRGARGGRGGVRRARLRLRVAEHGRGRDGGAGGRARGAQRARVLSRAAASASTSGRLQNANRTYGAPCARWS